MEFSSVMSKAVDADRGKKARDDDDDGKRCDEKAEVTTTAMPITTTANKVWRRLETSIVGMGWARAMVDRESRG